MEKPHPSAIYTRSLTSRLEHIGKTLEEQTLMIDDVKNSENQAEREIYAVFLELGEDVRNHELNVGGNLP
jgi:hypothetical protein